MNALVEGQARKILIELALNSIVDSIDCDVWEDTCPSCNIPHFLICKLIASTQKVINN